MDVVDAWAQQPLYYPLFAACVEFELDAETRALFLSGNARAVFAL